MSTGTGTGAPTGSPIAAVISSRDLARFVGTTFDSARSLPVSQQMVADFAALTGADHWTHTDPDAARDGPLGRASVQGLLTLSLGTRLEQDVLVVQSSSVVSYGFDKVRFPAPMFVGDRLRLEVDLLRADAVEAGIRARLRHRLLSSGPKPVCVAEQIVQYTH